MSPDVVHGKISGMNCVTIGTMGGGSGEVSSSPQNPTATPTHVSREGGSARGGVAGAELDDLHGEGVIGRQGGEGGGHLEHRAVPRVGLGPGGHARRGRTLVESPRGTIRGTGTKPSVGVFLRTSGKNIYNDNFQIQM